METIRLIVTDIRPAGNEAILVNLKQKNGQPVCYQPGQFLTFLLDYNGKEERRSYSICSTPGVDDGINVLVKRVENGSISRYLIAHLRMGDEMTSLLPAGRFTLSKGKDQPRTVFFLAAGSGISPIYSLLKQLLFNEPGSNTVLIYQNRDEYAVIFQKELANLLYLFPNRFSCTYLFSSPQEKTQVPRRLNNTLFEKMLAQYLDPADLQEFYICGPYSFMRMIQFVLKLMGVKEEHIRKENFVVDGSPPPVFMSDTSTKNVILRTKNDELKFSVTYPETILQAAIRNNVPLPYSCRGGSCATCTVICVSGKVHMRINEVLTTKDLQEGLVLTCVGYAETNLELKL